MKNLITTLLSIVGLSGAAFAQTDSPFRLEKVVAAFEQMLATPGFDTSKPLQWGFFFISSTSTELQNVRKELEKRGYIYVSEHQDENKHYWLELAKIEIHTPDSLHKRNLELFSFAKNFKGVTYDGWDVTRSAK